LRELEQTISTKSLWPQFKDQFANADVLAAKFNQLAELRNRIRHSRSIDDIALKEGEAAVLWFQKVLSKPAAAASPEAAMAGVVEGQ